MRNWRTIAGAAALAALVGVSMLIPMGSAAQSGTTELSDVLAQLRRNAKVSERLNAGFFRAPQTRSFVGSSFVPADSNLAYTADRGDSGLSLDSTRSEPNPDPDADDTTEDGVIQVPQTRGVFEIPLDIPNRAQILEVIRSYNDVSGNNTTTNGTTAPSGYHFQIIELDHTGGSAKEIFGARSTDGRKSSDSTTLPSGGYRVDNSRKRYVLRVTIDEVHADSRFYGMTIQYVIGRGVPGAPTS